MGDIEGEKCGVFGGRHIGEQAARLIYPGIFTLQHRGQEAAGISTTDNEQFRTHKDNGLVAQVFVNEADIEGLVGDSGLGHVRYGTYGGRSATHAQPVHRPDGLVVGVHNGNLPSVRKLQEFLSLHNSLIPGSNDSEMMLDAVNYFVSRGATLDEAVSDAFPLFTGAFSCLFMTKTEMVAVRDRRGIRPLSIGRINGGHLFSSETCAIEAVGATHIGDVLPAEMVSISNSGGELQRLQLDDGISMIDAFEIIYFLRPDSLINGERVNEIRRRLGKQLWNECPLQADVVIPVPDSAIPSALGYAQSSGIPFDHGFVKSRYIGRTFIQPDERLRKRSVALKLRVLPEVVKGKRVIVVDDSILFGNTSGPIIKMLREAGAKRVIMLITCPPICHPDFYGVDIPDQYKLIAARMPSVRQICEHIDADFLYYLSLDGMIQAIRIPKENLNTSYFTGEYPIDLGERAREVERIIFQAT